jgi:hypothetical protein
MKRHRLICLFILMLVGEINIGIRDSYTSKCFWNCPCMTIGRIMQINKEHMKNYRKPPIY